MVIWITGISGAGKTTLCSALFDLLEAHVIKLVVLDGDVVRSVFGNDLDYSEASRVIQIKRIQLFAKIMDSQDFVVLVGALYANPDLLWWNRTNFSDYYEVYIDAPLSLVQERDAKGLYAMVKAGDMNNVVGIDIPWHAPANPDLRIDATKNESPDDLARRITKAVAILSPVLEGAAA